MIRITSPDAPSEFTILCQIQDVTGNYRSDMGAYDDYIIIGNFNTVELGY